MQLSSPSEAQGVKEDRRVLAGFACADLIIRLSRHLPGHRGSGVRLFWDLDFGLTKFSDWNITEPRKSVDLCEIFHTQKL